MYAAVRSVCSTYALVPSSMHVFPLFDTSSIVSSSTIGSSFMLLPERAYSGMSAVMREGSPDELRTVTPVVPCGRPASEVISRP